MKGSALNDKKECAQDEKEVKSGELSFPTPKIKIKTTENARPALQALASIIHF